MSARLVDWDVAVATARRLVRPGPPVDFEGAAALVADLRRLAVEADEHVREFTGLSPAEPPGQVSVVDRPGWVQANVDGFRVLLDPLADALLSRRGTPVTPLVGAVGSRVTGAEVGAVLAYLAGRVLGQYELFLPAGQGNGRLTLVAPNILAAERALAADPHDFRLWVCLHEMTHRTQFTAVPWLREHVQGEVAAYLTATDLDPAVVARRLRAAAGAVLDGLRGRGELSLIEVVQTPEQRVVLDRITAMMSLLEGHGEFVMDGVGPEVVPTAAAIRARFDTRRAAVGPVERLVRRLFGIDLKMRQYAEGARFVRAVVDEVGMTGFNQVWTSPQTLPTRAEVTDPSAWVQRVVRRPPAVSA